jgi:hypothetical protein
MSNERIDLTQFEGHTKGNWCIDDGNLMIKTDELWIRLSEAYCDDGTTEDEDTINKKLMVSGPDLIAELKRCYERLDMANETMLTAREVLMKHHEWMSVNDSTSEEDDQEILDVVKALREASE